MLFELSVQKTHWWVCQFYNGQHLEHSISNNAEVKCKWVCFEILFKSKIIVWLFLFNSTMWAIAARIVDERTPFFCSFVVFWRICYVVHVSVRVYMTFVTETLSNSKTKFQLVNSIHISIAYIRCCIQWTYTSCIWQMLNFSVQMLLLLPWWLSFVQDGMKQRGREKKNVNKLERTLLLTSKIIQCARHAHWNTIHTANKIDTKSIQVSWVWCLCSLQYSTTHLWCRW